MTRARSARSRMTVDWTNPPARSVCPHGRSSCIRPRPVCRLPRSAVGTGSRASLTVSNLPPVNSRAAPRTAPSPPPRHRSHAKGTGLPSESACGRPTTHRALALGQCAALLERGESFAGLSGTRHKQGSVCSRQRGSIGHVWIRAASPSSRQ